MLPNKMFNEEIFRIVLSKPAKNAGSFDEDSGKATVRVEVVRNAQKYQSATYRGTQVFHGNHNAADVRELLNEQFGTFFLHYTAWDGEFEYSARVSKKGKVLATRRKAKTPPVLPEKEFADGGFNRRKNHIICEGADIPVLVDMGVFTNERKVAAPMWDKFHQINRFLELLADETDVLHGTTVNIIDFGCGKSYLTFLVYHYFTEIRGFHTNICGLDLNAEIVGKCTAVAKKYGYSRLTFRQGDIGTQTAPPLEGWGATNTFNIVISLHACDTATDHALFNAIRWNSDLVCAVPCCQHELRNQMNPRTLKIFADYGIVKERIASLATDAIRAKLLEIHGYKTQIIEFTAMEHTPKNLFIRARRTSRNPHSQSKKDELNALLQEFGFEPTLLRLLD